MPEPTAHRVDAEVFRGATAEGTTFRVVLPLGERPGGAHA